ncbi:MAG: hypothetical protein JNL04_19820 [Rhodospirillaceae bacterium]|nr:hypothetical protein [Rhodospirillaceae bacterium]
MTYIIAALLTSLGLTTIRFWRFTPPVPRMSPAYLTLLIGGLLSDLVASWGFLVLIRQPPAQIRHYSLIITLLSLFAAVTLIVKFAFLRDGSPALQRLRGWLAAVAVTVSLYLLFGSIAYYAKVIQDTNFASLTYLFVPAVMLIILWVNTAYDAWDFAERRNQLLPRPTNADATPNA